MDALSISLSGLDVEWRRIEIAAQNIANMNSTRTADGTIYRPMRLLSGPVPANPATSFAGHLQNGARAQGVTILSIEADASALRRTLDPSHPDADADGFVTYPNVDHAAEMTLMIRASRVYEANLAAFSIAQDMYGRALELGGRQ